MIENDLPQGVLKEEKYQKTKSKLKKIAFIIWGVAALIAGTLVLVDIINTNNNNNSSTQAVNAEVSKNDAIRQELADIEDKIDTEKRAIFPTYDVPSTYSISLVGWDENERIETALDLVDAKYVDDVQTLADKVDGLNEKVTAVFLDSSISRIKSSLDYNETKAKNDASFNKNKVSGLSFIAIPVVMFGGIIGLMLMLVAHQREMAAYGMQGTLPVASEGMGKMVKSLDDNGTLDIIAETGAKMMGKTAEAQMKHNVPQKQAELEKAQVEAQNKAGATELSSKQQGKYAEEIGKGLKKGLFKK